MPAPRTVLLVGPNPFEPRKSMWLFVDCLRQELPAFGLEPLVLQPRFPRLGRLGRSRLARAALRLVLESAQLRRAARAADLVHVCDHASAFLLPARGRPALVTCHDVLFLARAVEQPASVDRADRWWQRRTLRGICRSDTIACVSRQTQADLHRIIPPARLPPRVTVVRNGLYQTFGTLDPEELSARLRALDPALRPGGYVLHVGGNFARKNRHAVPALFAAFGPAHGLRLVLAGEPPDDALRAALAQTSAAPHSTIVAEPDANTLGLLYQGAFALLFPSRAEGFGLPPLEAQTLGCPVVCSDIPVHRENLEDSALLAGPEDAAAMVAHLKRLLAAEFRRELIARGHANAARFSTTAMIERYVNLYDGLMAPPGACRAP